MQDKLVDGDFAFCQMNKESKIELEFLMEKLEADGKTSPYIPAKVQLLDDVSTE